RVCRDRTVTQLFPRRGRTGGDSWPTSSHLLVQEVGTHVPPHAFFSDAPDPCCSAPCLCVLTRGRPGRTTGFVGGKRIGRDTHRHLRSRRRGDPLGHLRHA